MDVINTPPSPAYLLKTCSDTKAWDDLIDSSAQGHVFSKSAYLKSLGKPYTCHVVTNIQGDILAGAAILQDGSQMAKAPFAFTPHQGMVFSKAVNQLSDQKRLTAEFRITEFFMKALLDVYANFSMAFSPYFKDLRPFLWHNHDKDGGPKFDVKLRYTGHIQLQNFDLSTFLGQVRVVRRQEYKKTPAKIKPSDDLATFMHLYQQTFERQGINVTPSTLSLVEAICDQAMSGGYGFLSAAWMDERVASMAFFVTDRHCAYYLFGANDPLMRDAHASSKLLLDNISEFAHQGFQRFDFVGVNSPFRGDFKLSFNAELIPYQEVNLLAHA